MPTTDPLQPNPSQQPTSETSTTLAFSSLADIPLPASLATIDEATQGYLAAGHSVRYYKDHGLRAQPVAAARGSALCQVVRIHAGVCVKTVSGVAVRVGQPAIPPHTDTQSDNEVLLTEEIVFFAPGKLVDGNNMHGAVYVYHYLLQAMPGPADYLDAGKSQIDLTNMAQYRLSPAQFVRDLIAPAAPVGSPPASIPKIDY